MSKASRAFSAPSVPVVSAINAQSSGTTVDQAPSVASATYTLNTDFGQYAKVLANPNSARGRTLALAIKHAPSLDALQTAWLAAASTKGIHHDQSKYTLGISKTGKPHEAFRGWLRWLTCNNVKGGEGFIKVTYPK